MIHELEKAWKWREDRGVFKSSQVCRVFHGPAEGGLSPNGKWCQWAIDRFADAYWVTCWEKEDLKKNALIADFLRVRGATSVVVLGRPQGGVLPEHAQVVLGPDEVSPFTVVENEAKFQIRLTGVRHPGLFLDHLPLRQWLSQRCKGQRVLNTFAYTGSLSVAAAMGGASEVTTLDLSKPSIQWAQENWDLNQLSKDKAKFIAGDTFEWLPRFKKMGARFDCIILDPPSFSRGKKGNFSTAKDLTELHSQALSVLEEGGILVTSINSANIARSKFEADLRMSLQRAHRLAEVLYEIQQPETFPSHLGDAQGRYLKGWILRISSGKGASK